VKNQEIGIKNPPKSDETDFKMSPAEEKKVEEPIENFIKI
jgi:hypothetical protein